MSIEYDLGDIAHKLDEGIKKLEEFRDDLRDTNYFLEIIADKLSLKQFDGVVSKENFTEKVKEYMKEHDELMRNLANR